MFFDIIKAEQELREAFYCVMDQLSLTREDIDTYVERSVIASVQAEREKMIEPLRELKSELETMFRNYRIKGRIKSLTSILGKLMQERTLMDAFGMKIITDDVYQCYCMKSWIEDNFKVVEFEDRIRNPKPNGYSDLKIVVEFKNLQLEFIIQTNKMYVDSRTLQPHWVAYPWKYHPQILNLPFEYRKIDI